MGVRKYILEYNEDNHFIILNDDSATHVTRSQESLNVSDIRFCSANIGVDFTW